MTEGDRHMLAVGRENGVGDGFTVPRHLPGEASGSCSFAVRPNREIPREMLHVAEIVGAFALASARRIVGVAPVRERRSEEHTSELQSLMRISSAVFCLKKKTR